MAGVANEPGVAEILVVPVLPTAWMTMPAFAGTDTNAAFNISLIADGQWVDDLGRAARRARRARGPSSYGRGEWRALNGRSSIAEDAVGTGHFKQRLLTPSANDGSSRKSLIPRRCATAIVRPRPTPW
jgi:hypothetical protein